VGLACRAMTAALRAAFGRTRPSSSAPPLWLCCGENEKTGLACITSSAGHEQSIPHASSTTQTPSSRGEQIDATGNIDAPTRLRALHGAKLCFSPTPNRVAKQSRIFIDPCPFRLAFCLSAQRADVRQSLLVGQSPPMSRTNLPGERQTVRKRQKMHATRAALRVQVKISAGTWTW
jgi:hypothetical protein